MYAPGIGMAGNFDRVQRKRASIPSKEGRGRGRVQMLK